MRKSSKKSRLWKVIEAVEDAFVVMVVAAPCYRTLMSDMNIES